MVPAADKRFWYSGVSFVEFTSEAVRFRLAFFHILSIAQMATGTYVYAYDVTAPMKETKGMHSTDREAW
jgi:hypothetical protein